MQLAFILWPCWTALICLFGKRKKHAVEIDYDAPERVAERYHNACRIHLWLWLFLLLLPVNALFSGRVCQAVFDKPEMTFNAEAYYFPEDLAKFNAIYPLYSEAIRDTVFARFNGQEIPFNASKFEVRFDYDGISYGLTLSDTERDRLWRKVFSKFRIDATGSHLGSTIKGSP